MTQFQSSPARSSAGRPNVYTLMLAVATLALLSACIYVLVRHHTLFGNWNPTSIMFTQG